MRASGPKAPKFGPKQTKSLKDRDIGIGGGPQAVSGKGMGRNKRSDTGLDGEEAATMGRGARDGAKSNTKREGTEKYHSRVVNEQTDAYNDGGKVKGQMADGPGKGGVGSYDGGAKKGADSVGKVSERIHKASDSVENDGYSVEHRHGGHNGGTRIFGKEGRHSSTKKYEHSGYTHTSKNR